MALARWRPAGRSSVKDGAFSAEEFAVLISRLLEGTPVVEDEHQLDLLGRLGPKDMFATAVVLAAGEARTVEEALDFLAAGRMAVEARNRFRVLPGGSA